MTVQRKLNLNTTEDTQRTSNQKLKRFDYLTPYFVTYKGLLEAKILPYLEIEIVLCRLPLLNTKIRRFFTHPIHNKLFLNLIPDSLKDHTMLSRNQLNLLRDISKTLKLNDVKPLILEFCCAPVFEGRVLLGTNSHKLMNQAISGQIRCKHTMRSLFKNQDYNERRSRNHKIIEWVIDITQITQDEKQVICLKQYEQLRQFDNLKTTDTKTKLNQVLYFERASIPEDLTVSHFFVSYNYNDFVFRAVNFFNQ